MQKSDTERTIMQVKMKRYLGKPFAVFLAALLAVGLFPAVASAATHSFDVSAGDIRIEASSATPGTLSVSVGGAVAQDGIDPADTIKLTGTTNQHRIVVDAGMAVNLELDTLNITGRTGNVIAIDIANTTAANMVLTGTNVLDNGSNYSNTGHNPTINIAADASLVIDATSTGSLRATGNAAGPAIGGATAGSLTVNGGTIDAATGSSGISGGAEHCAIGGGYRGSMKSIVINGGTVTASAAKCAAIGATITEINGGMVTASNNPGVSYYTNPVIGVSRGTTTVTGGTVNVTGSGFNLGGSTIRVTGGSVSAAQSTFQTQPSNGAVAVYPAVINTGAASTAVQPGELDSLRLGLHTAAEAAPYTNVYGVSGVVSDASANVCLFLPEVNIPVIDVADYSEVIGYNDSGLPRTIAAGLDNPADLVLLNPGDFTSAATMQWTKNGSALSGQTSGTATVDERGSYKLEVTDTSSTTGSPVTIASQRTIELTAQYTVAFDKNGGFGYDHSQTKLVGTPLALDANGYTRTGYTFAGWNTEADGAGDSYADGAVLSTDLSASAGDTVYLYAQWTPNEYWAQFVGNGADAGTMARQALTYGDTSQTLTANAFGRTGYAFVDWNTNVDGTGTPYADQAAVTPDLTSDANATVSLFAQWQANSYNVTFDGNGSDGGSMIDQAFTYDDAGQALSANAFVRTGYTFTGWNTAADGSGQSYADGATKPNVTDVDGDTATLFAQWTANTYDIAFNGNGSESGSMDPIETVWDAAVAVDAPNSAFVRTGYTFTGWNTQSGGGGTAFAVGDDLRNIEPGDLGQTVVLYAQWQATEYDISFDGNGADAGSMADQPMIYDVAANLDTIAYSKTGYTFSHWTWTDGFGQEHSFIDGENVANLVSDGSNVVLVAQWVANSYVIQFNGNGATSGSMFVQPMMYDQPVELAANAFSRGGHDFAGWNTEVDGSGDSYGDGEIVSNLTGEAEGSVQLHAQWAEHAPTVTLDDSAYKHGDTVTVSGTGFEPNAHVTLTMHSTPVVVGTLVAKADGTLAGSFAVPHDAAVGSHTLAVDDGYHTALAQFEISASADDSAGGGSFGGGSAAKLPTVGDSLVPIAVGTAGLALLALLAVLATRKLFQR